MIIELRDCPGVRVTGLELKLTESPGDGTLVPTERVTTPEKPLTLEIVAVAVPISPEMNDSVVGVIEKPKSAMITSTVMVLERVSEFPEPSTVAYVP